MAAVRSRSSMAHTSDRGMLDDLIGPLSGLFATTFLDVMRQGASQPASARQSRLQELTTCIDAWAAASVVTFCRDTYSQVQQAWLQHEQHGKQQEGACPPEIQVGERVQQQSELHDKGQRDADEGRGRGHEQQQGQQQAGLCQQAGQTSKSGEQQQGQQKEGPCQRDGQSAGRGLQQGQQQGQQQAGVCQEQDSACQAQGQRWEFEGKQEGNTELAGMGRTFATAEGMGDALALHVLESMQHCSHNLGPQEQHDYGVLQCLTATACFWPEPHITVDFRGMALPCWSHAEHSELLRLLKTAMVVKMPITLCHGTLHLAVPSPASGGPDSRYLFAIQSLCSLEHMTLLVEEEVAGAGAGSSKGSRKSRPSASAAAAGTSGQFEVGFSVLSAGHGGSLTLRHCTLLGGTAAAQHAQHDKPGAEGAPSSSGSSSSKADGSAGSQAGNWQGRHMVLLEALGGPVSMQHCTVAGFSHLVTSAMEHVHVEGCDITVDARPWGLAFDLAVKVRHGLRSTEPTILAASSYSSAHCPCPGSLRTCE